MNVQLAADSWHVYIVRCRDGSLYTGVAKDLSRRIAAHNSPKDGAKYTRPRQPVKLAYAEPVATRSEACKREYRIKKLTLSGKQKLIANYREEIL